MCQKGHTILNPSCKSCLQLKREWNKHLEATGFDDIESKSSGISVHISACFLEPPEDHGSFFDNRETNYRLWVERKADNSRFRSETDRLIWECHSEGLSRREIAPRVGLNDRWVGRKLEVIEGYLKDKIFTTSSASYASA